jgi:F0F1-type ATP synthase assembly protein I
MVASLLIPTGIGYWLDRPEILDRRPLFTLIGLGIGTIIAFYGLIRMLRQYKAEQDRLNREKK